MGANDSNVHAFIADLDGFAKKTEKTYHSVVRWVAINLWVKFTDSTPVDTGRARASWNLSIGSPSTSVPEKVEQGRRRKPARPKVKVSELKSGKSIYVTSNLDYIEYLEAGSSGQAPGGMVEISIAEVEVEIDNAIHQL